MNVTLLLTPKAHEFACHSKACAPPPAGSGGSKGGGSGSKGSRKAKHVKVNATQVTKPILDKFGPDAGRIHLIARTHKEISGEKTLAEADHLHGEPRGMNNVPPPRGLTHVSLTNDHLAALLSYRGEDYNLINGSLRRNTDLGDKREATEKVISDMDEIFRMGSPTTRDITVYRAMGIQVESTVHDNGFMSTAYDHDVVQRFAGEKHITDQPIIKITIPKGSHAVKLSDEHGTGESEVLLPRGANLLKQPDGSYRYMGSTPN